MSEWLTAALLARQNEFFQYRRGLLDREVWEASEGIIQAILSTSWARNWWKVVRRGTGSSAFVAHVESLADQAPPFRPDEFLAGLRSDQTGDGKP